MKLNYKRTILVGFAFFLISAFWSAYDAIIPLALTNHYGLSQGVSGIIMSLDNILAVFMLPIFGAISDKISTRYGKRTPFVFIGTILAVISFITLTAIDNAQLARVVEAGIPELRAEAEALLAEGIKLDNQAMINAANIQLEAITKDVAAITGQNPASIIGFISMLLVLLISMATFRSPAVALMPDVTIKPLRSKGNAIINLMGTAGGIIVLIFGIVFATSKNLYMQYTGYVLAVAGVMVFGLVTFILTVKEKKWAEEMEAETERLGLNKPEGEEEVTDMRKLSKPELNSLILILVSVALWYIGYNAITSKYSVYATEVLKFDYNITLIIAQAAAIVSYIPVGMLASKIGRRRSILIGITLLTGAFFAASFITQNSPEFSMYIVFITAGIGWATINVNSFPMVVELAKGGDVGKYTGYYYTASMAAQIATPILSGFLVEKIGWAIFFPYAAVFVACAMVTMFFVKHGDARPEKKGILESLDVDD